MKIALIGYGKMGKAIEEVALSRGHTITLRITGKNLSELTNENLQKSDVAIEFTQPDAAFANVMRCIDAGVPVVCGTTGWNEKLAEAKKSCNEKKQALFHAPNFSIGVNIFFAVNEHLAKLIDRFPQYDKIRVIETHHTRKKDAPSGTAVSIANDLIHSIDRLQQWESVEGENNWTGNGIAGTFPVLSFRTGDVPGEHEVTFESDDDVIRLAHEAKGRMGFAKGAVAAAEWIIGKKGVFSMKDLLQL